MSESMPENIEKAFEIYYSQGDSRSYKRVAEECKVSRNTVYNWAKRYRWRELVDERDGKTAEDLREAVRSARVLELQAITAGIKQILKDINTQTQTIDIKQAPQWFRALDGFNTYLEKIDSVDRKKVDSIDIHFDVNGAPDEELEDPKDIEWGFHFVNPDGSDAGGDFSVELGDDGKWITKPRDERADEASEEDR